MKAEVYGVLRRRREEARTRRARSAVGMKASRRVVVRSKMRRRGFWTG